MLNIAAIRYRNVLAEFGGPVEKVETGPMPVRGRTMILANATLVPGLTNSGPRYLYSAADGSGTDPTASVARYKAVSEALERWAYHTIWNSDEAARYGFDVDPSTAGMAAFPGILARQARRSAVLEAVERYSLIAWWEGYANAQPFETDWPGVSAIAIDGPFGGVTVVAYARCEWGGYVYGHAAEESFSGACERAVAELARHELVLRSHWLASFGGALPTPSNILERRCLFFASSEGHNEFLQRVKRRSSRRMPVPDVVCDCEVPGPWSEYATVWRFGVRQLSDGYIRGGERYFFL